jgi:hypothetical protein
MDVARICEYEPCQASLDGRKANTRFHSDRCRVAAHRAEKKPREAGRATIGGVTRGEASVTARALPVAPGGLLGGPCPDPSCCVYRWRHSSGPWSCAYNHPRVEASDTGPGDSHAVLSPPVLDSEPRPAGLAEAKRSRARKARDVTFDADAEIARLRFRGLVR